MVGLGRVVVPVEPEEDSDPLSRSALRFSRESALLRRGSQGGSLQRTHPNSHNSIH